MIGRRQRGMGWRPAAAAAALLAAAAAGAAAEPAPPRPSNASARALMEEGRRRYGAGDYAGALAHFEEAERRAGRRLDPARARFNAGTALQRLGRLDEAAERLRAARETTDLETQAGAWYNEGTAAMARAEQAAARGDPANARAPVDEALEAFRNAIRLAPDDLDAKVNYEWALRRKKEIEEAARQQPPPGAGTPEAPPPEPGGGDPPTDPPEPGDGQPPEPEPGTPPPETAPGAPEPRPGTEPPSGEPLSADRPGGREREMTREDAVRMLDALRDDEDAQRRRLRLRIGEPEPVGKDW